MSGTATFGTTVLTSAGSSDVLVLALDPTDGSTQWALSGGGTNSEQGEDITADAAGNVYVAATSQGSGTYGSTSLPSFGGLDVVLWSLDFSGASRWAAGAGGPLTDIARGIAVLDGNVYTVGQFVSSTTMTIGAATLPGNGSTQIFVASASTSDGTWTCARAFGSTAVDEGAAVLASGGSLFVTASSSSNPLQLGAVSHDARPLDAVIFRMNP
jgi:hypothetical protein